MELGIEVQQFEGLFTREACRAANLGTPLQDNYQFLWAAHSIYVFYITTPVAMWPAVAPGNLTCLIMGRGVAVFGPPQRLTVGNPISECVTEVGVGLC